MSSKVFSVQPLSWGKTALERAGPVLGQPEVAKAAKVVMLKKKSTSQAGEERARAPPTTLCDQGQLFSTNTSPQPLEKRSKKSDTWAPLLQSTLALRLMSKVWKPARAQPDRQHTACPETAETQSLGPVRAGAFSPSPYGPLVGDWSRRPRNGPLAVKHAGQQRAGPCGRVDSEANLSRLVPYIGRLRLRATPRSLACPPPCRNGGSHGWLTSSDPDSKMELVFSP